MTMWCEPQPWSVPSPLLVKLRPNSDAVKVVTWLRMSPPGMLASTVSK